MHIKLKNNTRTINFLIIGFIILLIGGIIVIFVRHRLIQKKNDPPTPPEKTEATLTIKNFHHVATENGIKKWALKAASARLYSQKNIVKLNDISVIFFMHDNQNITLIANKGELNSETNDMTLSGSIVADMSPYTLATENLNYEHRLRIIHTNEPVIITGDSMMLKADTMTYGIDTESIKCDGNVEGSFIGDIK
ncbi:MAG: LPS export ABC transporter periplasmic protein LptC [Desulfobacteraceae bacterium]|nr:LPS export ABC transporter periplasmic protein LptC [Desulfobacteraceae bacterium]MBC2757073.1 LPS export ABC transporter periplasmic protein LptC [Desulfobacteraceae bacterium]MBC2763710.1 LPS export ABC transporter periplasmic protein LptC [ANME-2 cluster archaeon]